MSPFSCIAVLTALLRLAIALPAVQTKGASPSTSAAPATTQGPSMAEAAAQGVILTPQITYGSTVINGHTYPVVSGQLAGGYRFYGSSYSITGYAGGYLYNCYNQISSEVEPALCFGGYELDTEILAYNGFTLYDGGIPGFQTDVALSGKLPGPLSGSAAGVIGVIGTAVAGGAVTGLITPALAPGNTANGGGGAVGSVTLGPVSFGGQAGGSFVTQPSYTSAGAGAVGSLYVGPFGGAGTVGGEVVGSTLVGCAGLNVVGAGYTACVTS